MNKLVYKYRGGNEEIFERDLNSLEENCFFAPNFELLNDPSETMVYTDTFNTQTRLFSKFLGTNSKQHLEKVNDALTTLINRRYEIGIYSLSKTYKDELLWAHYANSHFGFCVEYDLDILIETYKAENIYSFPVIYSKTPPQIGVNEISNTKNKALLIIQKMLGYKSKRWRYEEEHRLIIDKLGEQAYDYKAVKAIYFGIRMEDKNKEALMNKLKGRGISYYQMFQKEKSYEFDAKPIDDIKEFTEMCDIGLIEGGCCNSENVHVLKDFRKNCKILVSVGECAIMGGLPAMRNNIPIKECLEEAYLNGPSTKDANKEGILPNDEELPIILDKVYPCHEVVKIDYYLPGCPPRADLIWNALIALVTGDEMKLPYEVIKFD